jgi:hypothetical protein
VTGETQSIRITYRALRPLATVQFNSVIGEAARLDFEPYFAVSIFFGWANQESAPDTSVQERENYEGDSSSEAEATDGCAIEATGSG